MSGLTTAYNPVQRVYERRGKRTWRSEDGTSTVLPYEQGIHRVANPNAYPAISLHLYGPRIGVLDGRDYDPKRDFVCDRLEFEQVAPSFAAPF